MIQKTEPCPLCGKDETSYERTLADKKEQENYMKAFMAGRKSIELLSKRENQIFDYFFREGIRDFKKIAMLLSIKPYTVETFYDRAMNKILTLEFEIWR